MPIASTPFGIILLFVACAAGSGHFSAVRNEDDPNGTVAFLKAFEITKKWAKAELSRRIDAVDQAKLEMRKSMIADDIAGIEKAKGKIAKLQSELRDLVDFKFPALDPEHLEIGQIGTRTRGNGDLRGTRRPPEFKGQDLLYSYSRQGMAKDILVYVVGMEGEWKKVGGMEIWLDDSTMLFVAVGEIDIAYCYEDGLKIPKGKAFEIRGCKLDGLFSKDELKVAAAATFKDFTITLTDSEKETKEKTIERNEEEKLKATQELKAKRARSFLESGKLLLKKDNFAGARKQFQKSIAADPQSESAKEAAELIEKLP